MLRCPLHAATLAIGFLFTISNLPDEYRVLFVENIPIRPAAGSARAARSTSSRHVDAAGATRQGRWLSRALAGGPGTLEVTADPAKAKKITDLSDVEVAKGTKARQLAEVSLAGKPMVKIETLDGTGTSTGNQDYVYVVDLKDAQDGGDTANVAVPMVFVNPTVIPLYKDADMKEKVKDLPVNTRMENTVCTKAGSYGMKIVDGMDLGLTGYVDQTLIQREQ